MIHTPSFWDLHLHGFGGIDFMKVSSEEEIAYCCYLLAKNGVGYFAPTLLTDSLSELKSVCQKWGKFIEKAKKPGYLNSKSKPVYAYPVGLHLEGPYLNSSKAGAHPLKLIKSMVSHTEVKELHAKAFGQIAILTLAPELKGALTAIRWLKSQKVRVQLGHSQASAIQTQAAIAAGAHGLTHLYNAMSVHHRDLGLLAALKNRLITAEIITDGVHVCPEMLAWTQKAAPNQIYAVSDGCLATKAPKTQRETLTLGKTPIEKKGPVAFVKNTQTLAGGALPLTHHPRELCRKGFTDPKVLFPLFYRLQRQFFSKKLQPFFLKQPKNLFDPKTFRFLGLENTL